MFLRQCNIALCRYVSLFGWSNGMRLIHQPQDLMECVGQGTKDLCTCTCIVVNMDYITLYLLCYLISTLLSYTYSAILYLLSYL